MKKIYLSFLMLFSSIFITSTLNIKSQSCASAIALTPGTSQSGNTSTFGDLFDNNPCLGSYDGGDDAIYSFTATSDGDELAIDIQGADNWSGASLTAGCPDTASSCVAYDTYGSSHIFGSGPLVGGVTYYLHISTYPAPQATAYTINSVFTPAPSCFGPTLLTSSNVTASSADISWTSVGTGTFQIQYDTTGFVPGTGTFTTSTSTSYSATGLSSSTSYDFYVRKICVVGDTSAWTGPFLLTTSCTDFSSPFNQGFGSVTPNCWVLDGGKNWNFDSAPPSFGHIGDNGTINGVTTTGGGFAWVDASGYNAASATLTSPNIDVSTLSNPELSFFLLSDDEGYGYSSTLTVTANGDTVGSYSGNTAGGWEQKFIYLGAYTGIVQIEFAVSEPATSSAYYDDIAIDDVSISEATMSCYTVQSLGLAGLTSSSADITWTAGGTETSWQVQYDTAGFVPGTGTFATSSSASYGLMGLTAGTSYDCYVRAICGVGDTSTWAGPLNFTTYGNCSSSGSYTYGNGEDASNAVGFIANTAGDWITLTFTAGVTENNYDYWFVMDSEDGSGNVIATGTGDIMTSATSGVFESSTGQISFYIDSDGSVGGQSFVYSLSCSAPPSCFDPTDFIVGNITTTSANISWTDSTSVSSWNTEYGPAGFTQGSGTSTVISSTTIANQTSLFTSGNASWPHVYPIALTSNGVTSQAAQTFTINVTSLPSGGANWRLIKQNQTTGASFVPNNTGQALVLGLNTLTAPASTWNRYVKAQFDNNTFEFSTITVNGISVYSPSLSLTGLTQGTTYWVYVQAACTNGGISGFAGAAFTTSCGVNTAPWNESFSSTMPNCWSESGSQSASYAGVLTGDNWNFTDYNAYAGYYVHIGGNYQDLTPFPFGYCAFVNGNEGDSAYAPTTLTSPEVSVVPLTSPELSFLLNSNRETETVNALLTVEAHNGSGTWDSIASFQGNTNGWIRQHVSLSAYSGDTVQVRFVYSEPDTAQLDHIAIDEITIGEAATCFEISNLSLSNVTGSSVDLDWSAGGSEASWDILASSSSGNVSSQSTDTSYTLTGLMGATNYNVYVRAVCGVGDTSVWYGPVSLFTYPDGPTGVTCGLGDTNATVFTDGLEAQGGWTGDFGAGNGIWKLGTGGTPSGGTGPDVAHEGLSYFFFESSTGSSQFDTATIYSPLIDLSDAVGGSAELSFWLHAYGNNMGNLHVGASSTLTGTYTNLAIFSGQIQGSSSLAYANLGLDLSAYAGDTVFLSFTYTRNPLGGFTQDLAIDLIEVNSCIVPPPHEMAIVAAAVASGCDLTATEPIELWVVNQGLVAESSFDLSYSVNGGTAVVENITSTLNVGDTLMHVFTATADMSADGVYNLDFGLVLALDSDTSNNSMMLSAENYLTPAALTTMGDTICNGETAMVTTVANGKAFWYDALTGGNLVGNGDNLDVSPAVTTSYYVEDAVVIGHSENFDSYTAGGYIVANDPENWAVWPGGGSAVDMPISDVQGNGGNSLRVFNMDGTDVVMEFGEAISTGLFNYSMDMYLVGDGYINFQEDVVIGTTWNMSVTFIGGVIDVEIDGASVLTGSFTSIDPAGNTVWNNFKFECDYSTGTWEVFADGVSQGTFVNPDPVASVNIYPGTGVEYYLDNVEWTAVTDDACRSARTEAVVTVEDCSNINELSFKDLSIYPNPNNGQFTITNSQEMTELIITDLQGKVILDNVNINLNKVNIDLTDFERGMYMINIKTIDGMITKTVTVQ